MSNPLSLRQLEYLVAVAETGQISRAALRCNVSQSSMTIALKKTRAHTRLQATDSTC
ncbi:LysR family transcriptional regulator [Photobacterium kishitanii]|uniref:LysR family transcriptional regulator n=1 Tax=Photobacterium kishitanii TaxID=318456 RepID=UPI001364C025|nr:LysR family transcriptional regulator [Photobacterium kishitanii]